MISIILEDPDFLIVEKPRGVATQGYGLKEATTLANTLAATYPELRAVGGSDCGAVHRLDTETSGLVVFARNQETYDAFRHAFSKNEIEKEYTAVVQGEITEPGRIDWPIGPDPKSEKKVKVYRKITDARRMKAQEATTLYEPIKSDSVRSGWAVKIRIKTGRRHQIRAHMAAIGTPLIGDTLYGGRKSDRLYLHASRLKFRHPRTGRWVEAISPCPFS